MYLHWAQKYLKLALTLPCNFQATGRGLYTQKQYYVMQMGKATWVKSKDVRRCEASKWVKKSFTPDLFHLVHGNYRPNNSNNNNNNFSMAQQPLWGLGLLIFRGFVITL